MLYPKWQQEILIFHFNRISLVGVLANVTVEPLLCLWSLPIGFTSVIFHFFAPDTAGLLLKLGSMGIDAALPVVSFFQGLSFASLYLPPTSVTHIAFYYAAFIFFLFCKKSTATSKYSLLLTVFLLLIMLVPFDPLSRRFRDETLISFLDVGQGSCSLLELPGGNRILIDGGAMTSRNFDIGERVIAPYLFHRGITRLDQIVITHPDSDHYSGIPFLLKHFGVKTLWVNGFSLSSDGWHSLLQIAAENRVEVRVARMGDHLYTDRNVDVEVLSATPDFYTPVGSNDSGLVLKFRDKDFAVLFPGDISSTKELQLLGQGVDVEADVLLAAHHGSKTSNSSEFLRKVKPSYVIVSSGNSRRSLFPAPQLMETCSRMGISLIPTHRFGTVTLSNKKGEYTLSTLLQK